MKERILILAAIITLIFTISCKNNSSSSSSNSKTKKTVTKQNKSSDKGTLLFFLNPDGIPCQRQDSYLLQNKQAIEKKAAIQYIRTTDSADRDLFYQYGIRALPSLILLDKDNNITKRFTPGIQSADKILEEINKL